MFGSDFSVSLATILGQSYTVHQNSNLPVDNWLTYTNFTGDGSRKEIRVPIDFGKRRFFRVQEP
jgi:hypothetical protein